MSVTSVERWLREGAREVVERFSALRLAIVLVWQGGRLWTVITFSLLAVQSVLPLPLLFLQKALIDTIAAGVDSPDKTAVFQRVLCLMLATAVVMIADSLCRSAAGYVGEAQAQTVSDYVQGLLQEKSVKVDLAFYESASYFDKLHRAQQESSFRPVRIVNSLGQVVRNAIALFAMVGVLFTLHWAVALLVVLATLPGVLIRLKYAGQLYRWQRDSTARQRHAGYYGSILLDGWYAKEIRLFGLGPTFSERFAELRTALREERLRIFSSRAFREWLAHTCTLLTMAGVYGYAAWGAAMGRITLGGLMMYDQAFQRALGALQDILGGLASLYDDSLYLHNLYQFLALKPSVVDPADPVPVPAPPKRGIVFENVSFRYPLGMRPVLENVNLELPAGKVVALVGSNGSGKSTLTKLLCRLYDPDRGRILVDGIDLRRFRIADLRGSIAVVLQDFMRYQLPAEENIRLGNVSRPLPSDSVRRAARAAGIDPVIEKLPLGYETILGRMFEDGEELSVGEWQKMALARAYLRDAPVLVLDEPTSAMDPAAEAEFLAGLRELSRDRTTLVISHRLSTVRMAHRIYVIAEGRIVEQGTHEELMRAAGTYARLYRAQADPYH